MIVNEGAINGKMIFRNICPSVAPSMRAASKKSSLMLFMPARNTIAGKPTHRQKPIKMSVNRAKPG